MKLSITVYGKALTKGSAQAYALKTKGGRIHAGIKADNPKLQAWEQAVRLAAVEAMAGRELIRAPVTASMEFFFARPKAHYRTGRHAGELRPSAPVIHDQNPDLDKLTRAVFDGLTGIVFDDDSRVYEYREPIGKRWTQGAEHAEITIETEPADAPD